MPWCWNIFTWFYESLWYIFIYNDNSHILDLVFVDHDFLSISPLFKKLFHHSPITIEFCILNNYQPAINTSFVFDFKNASFVGLNVFLIVLSGMIFYMNLDEMYSKMLELLHLGINQFIPCDHVLPHNILKGKVIL